jgi:hypothetical protein
MPLSRDGQEGLNWRRARRSMNAGNCTEVAAAAGVVAVRDSKDPYGLILNYPASSWRSFVAAASMGDFDAARR